MELPNIVDTLYSRNALQFPDLETAEKSLFLIHEDDRARITHLRIPGSAWVGPDSLQRMGLS
jgi:hypothetical protein